MKKNTFFQKGMLERLLSRTGGWYIPIVTFFVQVTTSVTTLLGAISEQLNADYTEEVNTLLNNITSIVVPTITMLLVAIVFILTKDIRARLDAWKQNPEQFRSEDNDDAWRSSQNITWKYALAAAITSVGFILIPKTILISTSEVATTDQVIYSLISGLITSFAFIPFSTVLLDRLMDPVREILLPNEFAQQLSGLSKLKILYKILAVVFFSLVITNLLISPIGYHQTTRALFTVADPYEVLNDLRIQSILVGVLSILFATGLAYLFSRSVSDPLKQLLETFQKVESGDLNARAPVVSTDEVGRLAIYFNRMVARLQDLQTGLEKKVNERTSQLKAINEVGRVANSILDPDELLNRVVNLITEEFGYYYSAIYLIDQTGQWGDLRAATGEAGRVFMESKHRIEINTLNIIGQAIRSRQAQVALDVGEKAIKFNNPMLPYTRSEISLPLFVGDRILGALDVQATQEAAFSEDDVETLQNMANQVAISLDNARLFQETRQNLNEMRNIQKQYLREAWIDTNLPYGKMSLGIGENIQSDESYSIEVPITLRDQIVGQLSIEGKDPLSPDEQNWVQAIATQAALALENARLLEESQSTAMREKFVTEITNKIWASTTMEGVLQTAVRELGQVLDATEATIEIDVEGE